jgi:hypothetical protein
MIYDIHIEVILVSAYALLLVGIAAVLEMIARHSHNRSEHFRHSGFVYKKKMDVWECPTGHHLTREQTDFERKIAHYRAPKHQCNACHIKHKCTDSNDGRLLESRLDAWLQSELSRFHRGISLALMLLAVLILTAEMFRHQEWPDLLALMVLLLPIGFVGSRRLAVFLEKPSRDRADLEKPYSQKTTAPDKNLT